MKKFFVIIMVFGLCAINHIARADEVDPTSHLTYTVSSSEVTITGMDPDFTPPADYALVIPDEIAGMPVVAIGNQAFLDQTTIASITIGDNVRTIGTDAVRRCTALTEIIFSTATNLTTIGESAFRGCKATSISIPEGVTTLGKWSIGVCSLLERVSLPSTLTTIGIGAFNYCPLLDNVSIPASVVSIGDNAFDNCTGLTSISIASGPTSIGPYAFQSCTQLASIAIPSSVTTIGNYAFKQCTALEEVTIPSSVTYFGTDVFNGCTGMVTANIDCPTIPVSFLSSKTSLQNVVIGPHVGTIGASAFKYCTGLSSVSIADGATILGESAFQGCTAITNIFLPSTLVTIGNSAFNGCTALTSIAIPSTVTTMGTYIFQGCSQLASATFGSGINITSIPAGLFMDCQVLGNVTIPSGVTSIGQEAFRRCYGFTSISVPSGVTSIGGYAFDNCSNATSVSLPTGLTTIGEYAFRNLYKLTSFTIPTTVTTIGQYAMSYCSGLTSVEIPSSVTTLGADVFRSCKALTTVTFASGSHLTAIPEWMFYECENFTTIQIPASVKTIGNRAFYNTPLESVTFEANSQLTTIGEYAFWTKELESIVIPASVKTLGSYAFTGCEKLSSVTFEANSQLTTIGDRAFNNCTALTGITIPAKVSSIGANAFFNCQVLASVVIPASVTSMGTSVFQACSQLATATFASGINLTSIPAGLFMDCTALENVNIPTTVTVIDKEAFRNCTKLPPVTLPSGLTTIGELAFFNDKFNSLTIPESVTSIGKEAFAWCTNISTLEISANVTSMGTHAFNHCTNLNNVIFAAPTMPNYAFQECANLTNVTIAPTVTSMGTNIFRKCISLRELVIPRSVQSIGYALVAECTSFETLDLSACSDLWDLYKGNFNASEQYESSLGLTGVIILLPPGSNATGTDIYLAPQPNLSQDGDGYYLIGSPEEYTAFAALVRSTPSANARITADIVLTGNEPTIGIGPDENNKIAYGGIFDGQGHSISINFTNDNRIQHNYGGLFTWTTDATIRNLWVKGLMETTKPSAGGIVGGVKGTLAIERCISSVAITGVVETLTEMYLGGFIGQTHSATITANDCLTTVTINGGTNVKYVAGITGRVANSSTFEIHRCLSMTNLSDATSPAAFAWKWSGSTSIGTHNLYWSDGSDGDLDAAASAYQTAVSHTQLADGTIATFLQAGRAETIWVQDAVSNLPALKLFASAVTTVLSSAVPAIVMGEDKYVTTFFDGTKSYRLAPGALAYTAGRNGTDIIFYRIGEDSNIIPQGTAVIIVSDTSYIELIELESTSVSARAGNILSGSDTDTDTPAGTVYVLGVAGETPGFYVYSGATIPAGKAYYVAE
ncbi:MAG: leucine-rich repeat protein [Bacteroidales bacterium]|nr:leucine-rich repeat protein [Bacteroidales bacterium]